MTAQEESDGNRPSSSAKRDDGSQAASDVSTQDVHTKTQGSGNDTKTVDFMTMAMFIIGKPHRVM